MNKLLISPLILLTLSTVSCTQGIESNCLSDDTQSVIAKTLSDNAEKIVSNQKYDDGTFIFDTAKIRASLAQIQISLESVRTVKEDPNSSKKFCASNVKITIPTSMLSEIEKAREMSNMPKISQHAREIGVDDNINVFTKKDFEYSVQPTDDKKEIYVETENTVAVSMIKELTVWNLLRPILESKKAQQVQDDITKKLEVENLKRETESLKLDLERDVLMRQKQQIENLGEQFSQEDIKKMSEKWNDAHNSNDVEALNTLFDDSVMFYGVNKKKSDCIDSKIKLLKKHPDFQQLIYGDISIEKQNNLIKSIFTKRVIIDQKATDYPSYLLFKKMNNGIWKIVAESDLTTDENLQKKLFRKVKNIPKDAIKGDFNGDGVEEYMWMHPPKINADGDSCVNDKCINHIVFSDSSIPDIEISDSIGGALYNLKDLNHNGSDEVGFLSYWFQSCWQPFYLKTLKNNQWIKAVDSLNTHCNQWDEGVKPIEIDKNVLGNVIIRYSDFDQKLEDIVLKTKSVKIAH